MAAAAGIKAPTVFENNVGTPGLMIRLFPPINKSTPRTASNCRGLAAITAIAVTAAFLLPVPEATAQSGYLSRDPNVRIDMSVLEELGLPATVAGQHIPSNIVVRPPVLFPPTAPPVSQLTGPLLNRQLTLTPVPAPRRQVATPRPTPAPPPTVVVQTPIPPAPVPTPEPASAPVTVDIPVAEVPTPPPPAPAPEPAPAPVVAVVAPEAAPTAAPVEEVKTAAPPPPEPAPEPAPEPVVETPVTPALTPSPTGAAPPAPVQTASRPVGDSAEGAYRVLFDDKSAKISDAARTPLQELSNAMKESEDLRVQLMAYAEGTSETASQARRLSLSRALAVRSFLINQGVRSTRMDVRALGNKAESGPADRVDAVLIAR